jgi:hypothetical protein
MSDGYINIEGSFDGTVSFDSYDIVGQKDTPVIRVRCTDGETGKTARGDIWCSEKALPYAVQTLRGLGVEGETDDNVLDNAEALADAPCSFEAVQNGDFFNAERIRAKGESFGGGAGGGVDKSGFLAKVFGNASPTPPVCDTADAPY